MRQQHLLGFAGEKKAPAKERSWLEAWCRVWWKLLGFPCSNFPKTGYSNSIYHYLFYWTQRHPRRNSSCAFATRSWIARPRQKAHRKSMPASKLRSNAAASTCEGTVGAADELVLEEFTIFLHLLGKGLSLKWVLHCYGFGTDSLGSEQCIDKK